MAGYDSPVVSIDARSVSLSVVEVWAFLNPKASSAKKTSSQWSVFGAQRSLGNRAVLPGAIVSHYHETLSYIKGHILQLFKEVEDYLSILSIISIYLKNLISLIINDKLR